MWVAKDRVGRGVNMHECFVIIESQVDFPWFPTTNFFVAFKINILADQHLVIFSGIDLTFHFREEASARLLQRNMNLNGFLLLFAQMIYKVGPKQGYVTYTEFGKSKRLLRQ